MTYEIKKQDKDYPSFGAIDLIIEGTFKLRKLRIPEMKNRSKYIVTILDRRSGVAFEENLVLIDESNVPRELKISAVREVFAHLGAMMFTDRVKGFGE